MKNSVKLAAFAVLLGCCMIVAATLVFWQKPVYGDMGEDLFTSEEGNGDITAQGEEELPPATETPQGDEADGSGGETPPEETPPPSVDPSPETEGKTEDKTEDKTEGKTEGKTDGETDGDREIGEEPEYHTPEDVPPIGEDAGGELVRPSSPTEETPEHRYPEGYESDATGHWKRCAECGERTEGEEHTFEEDVCTVCGYRRESVRDFEYAACEGGYAVVGLGTVTGGEIVLPATHLQAPVVEIGAGAFASKEIRTAVLPEGLLRIGERAFAGCTALREVRVPASLAEIGASAFAYCAALETFGFPATPVTVGAYAFRGSGLCAAELVAEAVGEGAFAGCRSLTEVRISAGAAMGGGTLRDCPSLGFASLPVAGPEIAWHFGEVPASLRELELTDGTLPEGYFGGASFLRRVTVQAETVPNDAFRGCTSLEEAKLVRARTVGAGAFSGCIALRSVQMPVIEEIRENAFKGCISLGETELPATFARAGIDAFEECGALMRVKYGGTPAAWQKLSFGNASANPLSNGAALYAKGERVTRADLFGDISAYVFYGCSSLQGVQADGGEVGDSAFAQCASLEEVELGDGVTGIGCNAFLGTPAAAGEGELYFGHHLIRAADQRAVTVREGTKTIAAGAFQECGQTERVTLPESVLFVGAGAFQGCDCLTVLELPAPEAWEMCGWDGVWLPCGFTDDAEQNAALAPFLSLSPWRRG